MSRLCVSAIQMRRSRSWRRGAGCMPCRLCRFSLPRSRARVWLRRRFLPRLRILIGLRAALRPPAGKRPIVRDEGGDEMGQERLQLDVATVCVVEEGEIIEELGMLAAEHGEAYRDRFLGRDLGQFDARHGLSSPQQWPSGRSMRSFATRTAKG